MLSVVISWASGANAFVGTNVLDDFNRANENPISGNGWTDGITAGTGCQIATNELTSAGDKEGCWWSNETFGLPHEVFGTLPNATNHATNTSIFPHVCIQGGGTAGADSYRLRIKKIDAGDDQWVIEKFENGGFTSIGALTTQEVDDGDKAGLEVFANGDLDAYYDGGGGFALQMSRNDTTWTCTATNIGIESANTNNTLDDFGGGEAAAAAAGNPFIWLRLGK